MSLILSKKKKVPNNMNDEKVQEFNQFFNKEYNYLKGFTKSINPKNDYQSLLHTVYLRCYDRIKSNGFEGKNYMNFTRVALMNSYKSQYRQNKSRVIIDIEDPNYYNKVEEILLLNENQSQQQQLLDFELSYIVNGIYEYVDKYYSDKEKFIFKTYFLLSSKKINYKQLSEATHYSISTVSNIIKKIKKDLRENLIMYLKTGKKMDELLEEVRILITTKNVNTYWSEYIAMYMKLTGNKYVGCRCKSGRLSSWMQDWYNKNTNKSN
jgi:RNA polymerase sigma factor (sigma-70 family)